MKKEMLINVLQPEECRIAIVEDGVLEELYVERTSQENYVGNIYKGRVVNIEPSIQAAFVDFGVGRNGFLHVSDVEPAYYRHLEGQYGGRPTGRDRFRMQPQQRPRREAEGDEAETRVEPTGDDRRGQGRGRREEKGEDRRDERSEDRGRGRGRSGRGGRSGGGRSGGGGGGGSGGGGRGRGRSRSSEPGANVTAHLEEDFPPLDSSRQDEPRFSQPEPRDVDEGFEPPPYMDSVERCTDDGDHDPVEPLHDVGPNDLFFPRSESAPARVEDRPYIPGHDEDMDPYYSEQTTYRQAPEESPRDDDQGVDSPQDFDRGEERETRHRPRQDRNDRGGRDDRGRGRGRSGPGRMMGRPKPLIQDIFRRGQEVIVQVIKEGIGTKGPTLSTYISIAGRYLVLMPGLTRIGVSRKIIDEEQRRRLRDILGELKPPKGIGFIIRTAGMDRTKNELQRDLAYLTRLWQVVVRRIKKVKSPAEIYQESDMITRTIRDTFSKEIETVWVDERTSFEQASEFLQIVMPRYAARIKFYDGQEPLFHKYGIEREIALIQQRHVPLPNGGSIVIDQTEALVAIDVNSGNFRADNNAEETAYQMNLLAAKEIARQLRLRDLGGVIVNDFIDMREEKHRRGVERAVRDAVKRDRARTKILKMSAFGLIEMTRQRIRPSLKRSVYQDCPHCKGTGQVKTTESMSIDVMRVLQLAAHRPDIARVHLRVHEDVATYLLNKKRREITRLEEAGQIHAHVQGVPEAPPELLEFVCMDQNGNEVKFLQQEEPRPRRRRD